MKKFISLVICCAMLVCIVCMPAFATVNQNIPVGGSNSMELTGTIKPMIMSVTVPSMVPFVMTDTGNQNKVVSPRINIVNNSNVPISIGVDRTVVDISKIPGAVWSNSGVVTGSGIAVGFKAEVTANEQPTDLQQTKWLSTYYPVGDILNISAFGEKAMYVVGDYGSYVNQEATFKVTPTIVVSRK